MRKVRKYFHAASAWLWIALVLPGYSLAADPTPPCSRTTVDREGTIVCLPAEINRILVTCYGGAGHEIALLGGADRIAAQPSVKGFPQFLKIFPNLAHTPDAGSFNNINLEQIMVLKPDIVVAGIISTQGNQKIKELGIPVVVLGIGRANIDGLLNEFSMMGQILGAEKKAAELVSHWKEKLSQIEGKTTSTPGLKKRKVFYCSVGPPFRTEGRLWWGHHFIEASGGINVAEDITVGRDITSEQLIVWNPDVIITSANLGNRAPADGIRSDPTIKNVRAVKDNAIYQCPIGTFWWDRPSPEAILGILWLAGTLYPDAMKDINLKTETLCFFSRFYHYDLSGDEYNAFFKTNVQQADN